MFGEDDFIPKCLKLSILFMNCLYWFLGVLTVGVGLQVYITQMQPMKGLVELITDPAVLMMILGGVLFIVAIFGCIGTLRENICLLRWYLAFLFILLVMHVAMGAGAFIVLFATHSVKVNADDILQKALVAYKDDDSSADFINYVQSSLQCCGIGSAGYKDWAINPYFTCSRINNSTEKCSVPPSCCKFSEIESIDTMCGYGVMDDSIMTQHEVSNVVYMKGCIARVEEIIQSTAVVVGFVAFGAVVPLLSGVLLSTRMINSLEESVKDYWENKRPPNNVIHVIPSTRIYHIHDLANVNVKGAGPHDPSGVCTS